MFVLFAANCSAGAFDGVRRESQSVPAAAATRASASEEASAGRAANGTNAAAT